MVEIKPLEPHKTALVAIDLQSMIMARATEPFTPQQVLDASVRAADGLRRAGGLAVLVHVSFSPDFGDMLRPSTDSGQTMAPPATGYDTIEPALNPKAGQTLIVAKRQWGAFTGTDLDLQLRRRGIDTIALCGISTNIGVESTARNAYELGYRLVFLSDAMAAMSHEEHVHPFNYIFPRMGHIRSVSEFLELLGSGSQP